MTLRDAFDRAGAAAQRVHQLLAPTGDVAIVLGSGLGPLADAVEDARSCLYGDIPDWPAGRAPGHAGRLVAGTLGGRSVLVLSGRAHVYEGHSFADAAFPVRVLGRLGVRTLILTNAAGGISPHLQPGVLMAIDDHINLMGGSPLQGPNDDRLGPRFPDLSDAYSPRLRQLADAAARDRGLPLAHGVYLAVAGPSYETPAEIRAFRALGADAVGMSTVPETIAARHQGIEVLGLSSITNVAAGLSSRAIDAAEVIETGERIGPRLLAIVEGVLGKL
jgi:purine-nucleoside phosphorylase